MACFGIHTNELDAARDVMLRGLESTAFILDRMRMAPELRSALRQVLETARRNSEDATAAARMKYLDEIAEERRNKRMQTSALKKSRARKKGAGAMRPASLPSSHPEHVCDLFCDGQDGRNSECARERRALGLAARRR